MDFSEFKRRLGAEPRSRAPDMLEARASDADFEAAARAADKFENRIESTLRLPVDEQSLLDDVLAAPRRAARLRTFAIAASLVAAAGLTVILWSSNRLPTSLPEYLAAHYSHDGAKLLSLAGESGPADIEAVLARFEVTAAPALAQRIAYIKVCRSMHGKGAHMVVHTDRGLVTVFYLPDVRVEEGLVIPLADEQARMLAMAGGAVAIIGDDPAADEQLATLLHESLIPVANDA